MAKKPSGYGTRIITHLPFTSAIRESDELPVTIGVFLPKPKVDSALVTIERRPLPAVSAPYGRVKELVRAGFGQRRKMLRRSLAGVVDATVFEATGIRADARAEELDIDAWGRLAAWTPERGAE